MTTEKSTSKLKRSKSLPMPSSSAPAKMSSAEKRAAKLLSEASADAGGYVFDKDQRDEIRRNRQRLGAKPTIDQATDGIFWIKQATTQIDHRGRVRRVSSFKQMKEQQQQPHSGEGSDQSTEPTSAFSRKGLLKRLSLASKQ